ncbi:Arm DNA-binding domain-containing protein, partial [Allopontixanthobacter sp.]|uniref:Arm DNA-binding domain-containing protein n=1 Tax=Allopontixanthobacter sp. TaxID=2906452 RepID=UPI002AB9192A
MAKLTKTSVEAVPIPASGASYLWDDRIAGFGTKVLPTGTRKYVLKYRNAGGRSGRQRWLSLGTHGAITVDQARKLAQQASAAVAQGEDPQASRAASEVSSPKLSDAWARFEADHLPLKKATTQSDYYSTWTDIIAPKLGSRLINELTTQEVDALHKSMRDRPYRANRMLSLLSRLLNLSERWGWNAVGVNP